MRKLPPLNAVRVFEAAARHVSFTKAAEDLHVTHGAVSRQVALLEEWFGVKLFRRTASQLSLTESGRLYYREVSAVLDRLALASMDMRERAEPSVLRVSAPPTFMMRWMISRITVFQRKRPDVELRLTTSVAPISSSEEGFDVAIRGRQEDFAGWTSVPFMTELIAPVCHVDLHNRIPMKTPEDLQKHRLISYFTEPYSWDQWFAQTGAEIPTCNDALRFEQMYFALQATQESMGIGLFPLFLVLHELTNKQLCVPFGALGLRKRSYNVYFRTDDVQWSMVADFCDWLAEAGKKTELAMNAWAESEGWKL